MATMNIFASNAFSTFELTTAFEKLDYAPGLLGSLGIFTPRPSRTRVVAVERRENTLALIETTPIGAPPKELENDKRDIRNFETVRLAKSFTMYAEEVNGIRGFGSETELMQVQAEVARRAARIRRDMEVTHEHMRLGALQGILLDADGSTVIRNYFTEFGISAPTAINFALDTATTKVRLKCHEVVRKMAQASKGAMGPGATVHALCGDEFYDKLTTHPEVEKTFLNWQAAADLRQNTAYGAFTYGGITWHNYRGTDDNSTIAIPTAEAKFFPVGASEVFEVALGPAEFFPWVNAPGQMSYALSIPDRDRQAWNKFELYSYPLYMCTRPEILQKAVAA